LVRNLHQVFRARPSHQVLTARTQPRILGSAASPHLLLWLAALAVQRGFPLA
jgi:hypothetical protein